MKNEVDILKKCITQAYWLIEVGDRIGALRELSRFAESNSNKDSDHWLFISKKETKQ